MTGLENTKETEGQELAKNLVQKWVKNAYVAFRQSNGKIFEKYDVEQVN